jgi:5-methylcytosine-specific restriction endonuclease McrBC regulatory subunit McrC
MTTAVEEILARIDAKRSFSSDALELTEQSEVIITSESLWKTLQAVPPNSLVRLGLKLNVELSGAETKRVVRASNVIGSARVASEFGEVSINVEPKVSVERLVAIIDYMQGDSYFSGESTEAYSGHSDLLTLQVIRCLRLVLRTLASGSVRGYSKITAELRFVKGRADYCQLLSQLTARTQCLVKCTYFEHSIDTERNRVFKSALIKIAKLLSERDHDLFESARIAAYSLSAVKEQTLTRDVIERLARRSPRDAAALLACRDVLCDISISPHPNHARPFFSYAINMASLFQGYVNRIVMAALAGQGLRPVKTLKYPIEGTSSEIELDGLFASAEQRLLVESKYKSIRSVNEASRNDLYQTISYCAHSEVAPGFAVVFYPAESGVKPLELLGKVGGFGILCSQINLVAVNLAMHPADAQEATRKFLGDLLRKQL